MKTTKNGRKDSLLLPAAPGAQDPGRGMSRRAFFRGAAGLGVASALLPAFARKAAAADAPPACTDLNAKRGSYWREGGKYFVQENVDASKLADGIIRARVDGRWQTFRTRSITKHFFDFNIDRKSVV